MQTTVADALRDKAMAKEYLLNADKYVKAGQFEKAREQIDKARVTDPSNPYIPAFEERIKFFEAQQEKARPVPPPAPKPVLKAPEPSAPITPPPLKRTPPPVDVPVLPPMEEIIPPPMDEIILPLEAVEPPSPPPPPPTVRTIRPPEPSATRTTMQANSPGSPGTPSIVPKAAPVAESPVVPSANPPAAIPPPPAGAKPPTPPGSGSAATKNAGASGTPPAVAPAARLGDAVIPRSPSIPRTSDAVLRTQSITVTPDPPATSSAPASPEVNDQIAEMRKQLEDLTVALQHERKAREEVQRQQLDSTVRQFRASLEKAWQFGAPKAKDAEDLRRLAQSLSVSPDVETSVTREVKLAMYGRAVKEVIGKRKILKSSSSTLEWLRKVYQISLSEYLEYESQFLLDLVSDQFRGTMLFVAFDEKLRAELIPRFKNSGFAVVNAQNPEGALEKVDKLSPNVIICDSSFGEGSLSGVKFLHIIRANPKFGFVPFILLCDASDGSQIPSSDLRPNEAVITKPVDQDELNSTMNDKLSQLRHYISTL
jgi:hypothetical protein